MTTRCVLRALSALAALALSVTHIVHAGDPVQDVPAAERSESVDIAPGTKWLVTADLECEIKEIKEQAVSICVTGIQDVEQGVPMMSKVPYVNRMFKNVGVARIETRVVLTIPKEQIKRMVPAAGSISPRQEHLQKAVEHLRAAGFDEMAGAVAEQTEQAACQQSPVPEPNAIIPLPRPAARVRPAVKEPNAYEERSVASGQKQVLVKLKVVEVSLCKLRKLGLSLDVQGLSGLLQSESDADEPGKNRAASAILERDAVALQFISRLQDEGLAKILAEPTLVTVSGRPASFRSGGMFPVPIPQDDGRYAVEYHEFGTRVDLAALCLDDGRLRLEIRPIVSELDHSRSVTVGGTKVPGLRVRTVDTAAELMPGQTLLVTGLTQTSPEGTDADSGDEKQESEEIGLIVLATPTLIEGTTNVPPPVTAAKRSLKTAERPISR